MRKWILCGVVLILLSGCVIPAANATSNNNPVTKQTPFESPVPQATSEIQPTPTETSAVEMPGKPTAIIPESTAKPEPIVTATSAVYGPDNYPAGINPLTGLPVENPDNLNLPPALISITNFPASARPQAGLSYAPFVFEVYIGEGMTRFLAMFYGDFPKIDNPSDSSGVTVDYATIGPIRSGRISYESFRKLYNGFLVMASGASNVVSNLSSYSNIYGSDADNINSAMIDVTQLEQIAQSNQNQLNEQALSGLEFAQTAPAGGLPAQRIWVPYAFLNQVDWKYDDASGAYLRYQDKADGTTFELATDRLNGDPLTFENVVILFAKHEVISPTIIDLDLTFVQKNPALLFRDGKLYEIYWTTASGAYEKNTGLLRPIRFIDADDNPVPLKPGQTWVHVVGLNTPYYEVPDSNVAYDLYNKKEPGSGVWAVRWYAPAGTK